MDDLSKVRDLLKEAIVRGATPGAAFAVGHSDRIGTGYVGHLTYDREAAPVTESTLWDLASLTKVVGTASAAMLLHDRHALDLDQAASNWLPTFARQDLREITIRHLLLHRSGLPASFRPAQIESLASHARSSATGPAVHGMTPHNPAMGVENALCGTELAHPVGRQTVYSDVGFIALGLILASIAGAPLDTFLRAEVFGPLALMDTGFNPSAEDWERCAPTEVQDGGALIRGRVHDPTAWAMGGIAGHAGLFSTIRDVARFAQTMLRNDGSWVSQEVVRAFTRRDRIDDSRALAWDTPSEGSSAGTRFGARSFGHTGFTGTSIWVDPDQDLFAVLLTHRVHPTAANQRIRELRIAFHDSVVDCAGV